MKYKYHDKASSGKRQYWLAIGLKDAEIMHGLVTGACKNMPTLDKRTNPEYRDIYNRIRSMRIALSQAVEAGKSLDDTGKRVHSYGKSTENPNSDK